MELEIQHANGQFYTIDFDFSRGSCGTYFDAPEPHDLEINCIYDEKGVETEDVKIYDYFDQDIYDKINCGYFD